MISWIKIIYAIDELIMIPLVGVRKQSVVSALELNIYLCESQYHCDFSVYY